MRSLLALVVAAVVVVSVYHFYFTRGQPGGAGRMPVQAISITGVKNDLIAIAQAERVYFAEHGAYASLDELVSSGALAFEKRSRDGYAYTVEITSTGFTVTARRAEVPGLHYPTVSIDETMQVRQQN